MSKMDELLQNLRQWRREENIAAQNMSHALEQFKASDGVYTNQKSNLETAKSMVDNLESQIKEMAIRDYEVTQNKKPHDKVAIKIFKTFKIVDSNRVLAWVKTNLADALIYDERKIKDYATKIGAVEGTLLADEPRVQIASEL